MSEPVKFWPRLQTIFARGAPVIAIGPGCHRIGYDRTEDWERVVRRAGQIWRRLEETGTEEKIVARRLFLERFWVAQLCEDVSEQEAEASLEGKSPLQPEECIQGHGLDQDSPDATRIALATYLLCGLVEATRLLGATVETGKEPVMDWQHLVADVAPGEPTTESELLDWSRAWLEKVVRLAKGVQAVHDQNGDAPLPPALGELGLRRDDVDSERLGLLKLEEIQSSLEVLLENRFQKDDSRVSGAVVEWLSDLFWHVVVSGAKVPPSQSELSFYLNLHEFEYSPRRFSRSHPGEYRGPADDNGRTLNNDLKALLDDYDSGLEGGDRDWTQPREAFAWTTARSLIKTWREEGGERFTIALVSDYDLMLERAMIEQLDGDEELHVITPAWVNWDEQLKFKWLMGTFEAGDRTGKRLAEPKWEWLEKRKTVFDGRLGPVVIRLTGTPLFTLSEQAKKKLLETCKPEKITEVWPTAVFSEHDSVQAIMALTPSRQPGAQPEKRFREQLLFEEAGLTWDRRGWLFFGHRFSDWLPRLQLLITALMLAQDKHVKPDKLRQELTRKLAPFEDAPKQAVSRRFDWPERALIDALGIAREERDLAHVTRYFERSAPGERPDARTERYVREMGEAIPPPGE